ncbi:MAG: amino acid-binding protein [Oscillospiraceae bacterium]|nr:amino acid-binding protein [Oscillospiraceae bacterium]
MTIKQVSVFIENSPGALALATRLLGDKGFDLLALTLADTSQFGILRCLVARPDEAVKALAEAGFTARTTDMLAALVPDRPGGLAVVLDALAAKGIGVEYCYSFARSIKSGGGNGAAIVFRVEDARIKDAVEALERVSVSMLDAARLDSL